jgi:hypothetical protein
MKTVELSLQELVWIGIGGEAMKQKLPMVQVECTTKEGTAVITERRMQFGPNIGFYIWWKGRIMGLSPRQRDTHIVIVSTT